MSEVTFLLTKKIFVFGSVRTAGQYKISVLIGSSHIAGSPFYKTFIPGPIDARRSRLIRPASTGIRIFIIAVRNQ